MIKKFLEDREFYMNVWEVIICTTIAGLIVLFSGEPDLFDLLIKSLK